MHRGVAGLDAEPKAETGLVRSEDSRCGLRTSNSEFSVESRLNVLRSRRHQTATCLICQDW